MSDSMTLSMLLMLKDLASGPLGKLTGNVANFSHTLMAAGETGRSMGSALLRGIQPAITAFMEAEDAALRLDAAMMGADNMSHKLFPEMERFAIQLGNELPGTAAEIENMFAALIKEGVTAEDVLGGVGRATGNLAVITGMGFSETAKFAGQVSKSIGIAAEDMMGFMDTIQRAFHLGLSPTEIGYAYDKAAGSFNKFKIKGLDMANELVPVFSTLIKVGGMSAETAGTNWTSYMNGLYTLQTGTSKSMEKLRVNLKSLGVDFNLFEKDRTFKGVDKMMAMLDKIRSLDTKVQDAVAKELFGGGADSAIFEVLSATGSKGIAAQKKRADEQADLNARISKILTSLTNIWESATGAFSTTLGKLGKAMAPELKWMADMFGKMSDKVGTFLDNHPKIAKFIGLFALLGGATLFVGGTASLLVGRFLAFLPLGGIITFISTKFMHLWSTLLKLGMWNTSAGARIVAWVTGLPTRVGAMVTRIGTFFTGLTARIGALLGRIPGIFTAIGSRIVGIFTGLGRFLLAPFRLLMGVPGMIGRLPLLFQGITLAIKAMGLAALSNPLLWIAAAIVVAAVLIFKYWKPITGFFKGLWDGLKAGLAPIKPAFDAAFKGLAPILNPIMGALRSVWGWIKNLLKPVDDVGGRSQAMGVKVGTALAKIINKGVEVVTALTGMAGKFVSIGTSMMTGLISGITNAAKGLISAVTTPISNAMDAAKRLLGINSPSRVFHGFGQNIGQGLSLGMLATTSQLAASANKMALATIPKMPVLAAPGIAPARAMDMPAPGRLASRAGGAGTGGHTITFAPVIQVSAVAGQTTEQQIQQTVADLYPQFVQLMRRYEHDNHRRSAHE